MCGHSLGSVSGVYCVQQRLQSCSTHTPFSVSSTGVVS